MSKRRGRTLAAPGVPHPLYVHSVADETVEIVRFLGPFQGILTHWVKRGREEFSAACPGPKACKADTHVGNTRWKGYAPAQFWQEENGGLWVKCVFEITEGLLNVIEEVDLRGTCWRVRRAGGPHNTREVTGEQLEGYDPDLLPPAFCPRGQTAKMYKTVHILWGVMPLIGATPVSLPSDDPPPRCVIEQRLAERETAPITEEARARFKQFRERLRTGQPATQPTPPDRGQRLQPVEAPSGPQTAAPEPSRNGYH